MDRNTIIGFILIGLVLMVWMWLNAPPPPKPDLSVDSSRVVGRVLPPDSVHPDERFKEREKHNDDSLGKYFSHLRSGPNKIVVVETPKYHAELSTNGGAIKAWIVKGYKTWDQYPLNLINTSSEGDFHLLFYSSDGKLINTKSLEFESAYSNDQVLNLHEQDSLKVEYVLTIEEHRRIVKTFIFYGNLYSFDVSYRFEGMENIISNFEYQVTWESGLRYAEHNSINESNSAKASVYAGGEISEIDATKFNEVVKQSVSGRVSWVAARNKYFTVALIPREKESQGAYLEGSRIKLPDEGAKENYSIAIKMPFRGSSLETDRFTVFIGPLDFDVVRGYNIDLEKIMTLGAAWIIRPISEYIIIPLFKLLKSIIPNYGFVLIIFSLIVKVVLYPLTKTSMKSMQKMQKLQPMMEEIKEKYKDDQQKMNQQVMRLYKEYGVNPAGGCLPLLLQLPILYALWAVFSSAIELRQASFVWWIQDLSAPDVITKLPFRIPIFNVDDVSGLAVLMGVTMFVQQKMSVKDPRQKMMVWLMPILLTLMFNSFPAGLNLYYFVFNIFSIAQQAWINKQHKDEPLRKVEEKKSGGFLSRIAKNLPKR
ncbi:MAG: membrane protein insertase YidC [Ignavibacteria bacterium]|nr:membrane protein insertase YidC [Ignavibacteria bacterium]